MAGPSLVGKLSDMLSAEPFPSYLADIKRGFELSLTLQKREFYSIVLLVMIFG